MRRGFISVRSTRAYAPAMRRIKLSRRRRRRVGSRDADAAREDRFSNESQTDAATARRGDHLSPCVNYSASSTIFFTLGELAGASDWIQTNRPLTAERPWQSNSSITLEIQNETAAETNKPATGAIGPRAIGPQRRRGNEGC